MKIYGFITLFLISTLACAESAYIAENISTPVFTVPGEGRKVSNRLLPGTKVTIIKQDDQKKFALVEWAKGRTGWLSTRKLTSVKPAIARLKIAKYQMDALRKKIKLLETKVKIAGKRKKGQMVASLDPKIFVEFRKTIDIQAISISSLKTAIDSLTKQNKHLSKKIGETSENSKNYHGKSNAVAASGNEVDWFLWGGFVVALSFISGILITKVRLRKDRIFS